MKLTILCCHVVIQNSDDKWVYIFVTSALTVLGAYIIARYSYVKTKELELVKERNIRNKDFYIIKSNIVFSCHKLIRTITGVNEGSLNYAVSERLMQLSNSEQHKIFHKEQTLVFQQYLFNLNAVFEDSRSELQKHIMLYLTYCTKEDKEYIINRKIVIDKAESRRFNEYYSLTNIEEIMKKEELQKPVIAQEAYDSPVGKALNEIMNYVTKDASKNDL